MSSTKLMILSTELMILSTRVASLKKYTNNYLAILWFFFIKPFNYYISLIF